MRLIFFVILFCTFIICIGAASTQDASTMGHGGTHDYGDVSEDYDINMVWPCSDGCPEHAFCNSSTDFCNCDDGWTGMTNHVELPICYEDIDECLDGTANCSTSGLPCFNLPGSYQCSCPDGWEDDGLFCADIDECEDMTLNQCNELATCVNTNGSYTCPCAVGYEGDGLNEDGCKDIDECVTKRDQCHRQAICNNTIGNYTCTCKPGFNGTGYNVGGCKAIANEEDSDDHVGSASEGQITAVYALVGVGVVVLVLVGVIYWQKRSSARLGVKYSNMNGILQS